MYRRLYQLWYCIVTIGIGVALLPMDTTAYAASKPGNTQQYNEFWQQSNASDFNSWTLNTISVQEQNGVAQVRLAPGIAPQCTSDAIDGGNTSYDSGVQLCAGQDPFAPGSYQGGINYYNGSSFFYGTLTSPEHATQQAISSVIVSWNAQTPANTWLQTHVRVRQNGIWTHWYKLPTWASDFSTIRRHSISGQSDTTGTVATDTFQTSGNPAQAYQVRVTLFSSNPGASPVLNNLSAIAAYNTDARTTPVIPSNQIAWGLNLNVPQRSQMLPEYQGQEYGGGGEVWCSPTSTSMVMAYWANQLSMPQLIQTVPDAARDTYDFTYQGTGNWPYNTAYAARFGLHTYITQMYSLTQIEQWIKAGIPVIISVAYRKGELSNSPIPSTNGHIILIRGFTATGDVITNDPAGATNADVQRIYNRSELQNVWLNGSHGVAYILYPQGWPIPVAYRQGSW